MADAAAAGERLLVSVGWARRFELLVHDVGNERRFMFFIPALVALTALVLGAIAGSCPRPSPNIGRQSQIAAPFSSMPLYVVVGALSGSRLCTNSGPGVRLGGGPGGRVHALVYGAWPRRLDDSLAATPVDRRARHCPGGSRLRRPARAVRAMGVRHRTYVNYEASLELGPRAAARHPGPWQAGQRSCRSRTASSPVFVGRGFGNYEDRKRRDDVRYILTYVAPSVGYESQARILSSWTCSTPIRSARSS